MRPYIFFGYYGDPGIDADALKKKHSTEIKEVKKKVKKEAINASTIELQQKIEEFKKTKVILEKAISLEEKKAAKALQAFIAHKILEMEEEEEVMIYLLGN